MTSETPGTDGGRGNVRGVKQGSVGGLDVRGGSYKPHRGSATWRGVAFLLILAVVVIGAGVFVIAPSFRDLARGLARDDPQALRLPFVGDVIRDDLGSKLTEAAGTDDTPINFVVQAGETVSQISDALTEAGLIRDPMVFQYLVVTGNLDNKLQTGLFHLNKTMTPQAIVERLQRAPDPAVTKVTFAPREGLRIEQLVALLQRMVTAPDPGVSPLQLDPQDFYQLATDPPDDILADYPFLKTLPKGRSLEGFLPTGVYEVDADITAKALLRTMLDRWGRDIGQPVVDEAIKDHKDFYKILTIASLVQKETGYDPERDKIAGVYTNRLDPKLNSTGLMNADPTVIYAVDTMALADLPIDQWVRYTFWTTVGKDLNKVVVPPELESFQTYTNPGLPDGPIASPTLKSIQAALDPDTKQDYLYFYACPKAKQHQFARTLAEQNANIASCK